MFRVINSLTSVYDHFTQPSFDQLMEEINHIEDQLNQVQSSLNELAKSISDSSMRKQYVSSQRVVMESVRITYYYLNVTTELANGNKHLTQEDLNYWRTEINKWGSMLRESVSFLMDGFNGVNILAGDIIESIVAIEGEVDLINRIFITYLIGFIKILFCFVIQLQNAEKSSIPHRYNFVHCQRWPQYARPVCQFHRHSANCKVGITQNFK